jgi:hypothetical protein
MIAVVVGYKIYIDGKNWAFCFRVIKIQVRSLEILILMFYTLSSNFFLNIDF